MQRLLAVMRALRSPEDGCPWDAQQTFQSIAPFTIEEAYEVADAIEREDMVDLCSELGDLLFQVVFHAQMAHEVGAFDFDQVATTIADKLIRRHPNIFSDAKVLDADAQTELWEQIKAQERAAAGATSHLDDVPSALPALMRAVKLQKRAARAGFDWSSPAPILEKAREELAELEAELPEMDPARLQDELGDVLFVMTNLARKLKLDPDAALRSANTKFERRFRAMEVMADDERVRLESLDLEQQEALWQRVKAEESTG
ncbi:MAG: nucleoside triphosphate pyrophosphohydrolase [Pseudomonadota bacterium]